MNLNMMRLKGFQSYKICHHWLPGTLLIGYSSQFLLGTDRSFPNPFDFIIAKFQAVREGKDPLVKFDIPVKTIDLIIRGSPSELACFKYIVAGNP